MKKIITFLILLLIPIKILAVSTSATSSILMDQDSNKILYANNIHAVRGVASISKIMTAILACESGKLDDLVTINDSVLAAYGSGIYIKVGEEISLRDLVYGLMLRSGNDAALAIADYVGGSVDDFVDMMNKKAKEIGMKNSTFNNPSGLDDKGGNLSTAYDMALLMSYAMHNEDFKKITGTKVHKVKTNMNFYSWTNKNKLLHSYKYTTGGKTGFTDVAKRTLVTTASKDGLNLVAVTLNDGNDFLDHKNLFEYGFNTYKSYSILKEGIVNIYDDTYYKNEELYIKENFSYPLLESEKDSIKLKFILNKNIDYKENDSNGKVKVILNNKEIYETDVYVRELKVEKKTNIFQRIWKWIKNLW